MFSMGSATRPNISEWTQERLDNLKHFFNLDLSNFIIETVQYILFNLCPSKKVIDTHIELLIKQLNSELPLSKKYECSTLKVISYLFKDKILESEKKKDLMIRFSEITDLEEIKELNKRNLPINRTQKEILRKFYGECYLQLDTIHADYNFSDYLNNQDVIKSINNEYFVKVSEAFNTFIKENERMCADLFIRYMLFLMRLNYNQYVDKEFVKFEMIRIQKLWENEYYDICCSNMHVFKHDFEIKSEDIESYNESILDNIFRIANSCIITKNEDFVKIMEMVSENVISFMFTAIHYTKRFPIRDEDSFSFEQHDIDILMKSVVERILNDNGFRFLNIMKTEDYVKAINNHFQENALLNFRFFHRVKELYNMVKNKISDNYHLIEYDKDVMIAHLMQLFPILEIKIKELGIIYNIFPYKEDEKHFMESKDPSSILRTILEEVYIETQGFEATPDILFVYNFMYNGNSLNIRNECAHGRDYLTEGRLLFAFKVTLASLFMIIKRIEIIEEHSAQ